MLRHYLTVKAEHPDAILLYRMGDFFELFFEDATTAAPVLDVALTARQKGTASEAPMCGVPHHSVDGYISRLLEAGFKVAVCDQVEDPAMARGGLVRREVTRIVTPGRSATWRCWSRTGPTTWPAFALTARQAPARFST